MAARVSLESQAVEFELAYGMVEIRCGARLEGFKPSICTLGLLGYAHGPSTKKVPLVDSVISQPYSYPTLT